ncbi:MAG: glycosyltransferase family 4 protein [Clostridia bacterium]|nr:glycosyltransferase family 4 protein [Clostridia bacterium]
MSSKHSGKLNIAMLGHKRIPSREGGIEVVVEELSTRMVKRGNSVTCFNRRGHHVSGKDFDTQDVKVYKGVRIKKVFTIPKGGLAAMSASVTAAVCAAFGRYDVVHFHAEGPCAVLWIPKLFGKRCVATIHGLDHRRSKWGRFASWYIRTGEKCAVRFADEIIVLSKNVQNYFMETYGRETVYIPNGVSHPRHVEAREIIDKYGLSVGGYILFIGRLVPEKGLRYLIEAYKKVQTDMPLVIAGGSSDAGEFEAELQQAAADDSRIRFTGFIQGRILEELYSNAYIYVLPSDLEGMPLSLLEAMSYGNCCLTSDIPECSEVLEQHGFTFRHGDVADLTRMLQHLCDNPALVEEGKKNIVECICRDHDWEDTVAATLRLYAANAEADSTEEVAYESITG